MWNQVNKLISDSVLYPFQCTSKISIASPTQEKRYIIADNNRKFLIKIDHLSALERYECESYSRRVLIRNSEFCIANCIAIGSNIHFCFIVLEWFDANTSVDNWYQCGLKLAKLHSKKEASMFGLEQDNFLYDIIQPNTWHKRWEVFFAEERIGWQLQLLAEKGIQLININEFVATIKNSLPKNVTPSLLHGNFWSGNVSFTVTAPCISDPAVFYGDRYYDLAFFELYNPFPEAFLLGYRRILPIKHKPNLVKNIYQLYPILIKSNLFAGNFINHAKEKISTILNNV